jgi:hypothetical protein
VSASDDRDDGVDISPSPPSCKVAQLPSAPDRGSDRIDDAAKLGGFELRDNVLVAQQTYPA